MVSARALKCKDIDLRTQTITISATFSGSVYRQRRKGRKSRPSLIPIHPEMFDYVFHKVKDNHPEAFLFINPRSGNHYTQDAIFRLWRRVRTKAGIAKEDLRLCDATKHSYASQLAQSNTSLIKISKLLGHSSLRTTEKYIHQDVSGLRAEVAKISLKRKATVTRLSPRMPSSAQNGSHG